MGWDRFPAAPAAGVSPGEKAKAKEGKILRYALCLCVCVCLGENSE